MKAFKIELFVIDFDNLGADGIRDEIENTPYGNDCIHPIVKKIEGVDIGEWSDNHPLNHRKSSEEEYRRLFPK